MTTTTESAFEHDLAQIVAGRYFPATHYLDRVYRTDGYEGVVTYCDGVLKSTNTQMFSSSWEAYRSALGDVKVWALGKAGLPAPTLFTPRFEVGQTVVLTYRPALTDNDVYEATVTVASDAAGDFDVQTADGNCWSVLAVEVARGDLTVEVKP